VRRFEPGETVVLRERLRGRPWRARPATVVLDADDLWMFFLPIGNRWIGPAATSDHPMRRKAPGADWALVEHRWTTAHVLSFAWPGAGAAVLHFWDESWSPRSWYVNVEAPLRRFELGFDTLDHDLDIVLEPDRSSWHWKDEDDVAEGIRLGVYTPQEAEDFRREAEVALRRVLDREPPFDREWADWRPDPSWPTPVLPEGWDRD
jgi:predicted RNA-binding protein associated with RNAse of E/G family